MGIPERGKMSADEFLDWNEKQAERHELVDGIPLRMMTGARQSHNVATSNIVVALAPSAKAKGCRTTFSDTAVRTGKHAVRYPDIVVDCGPPDPTAKEAIRQTIVVEVSSPGTLAVDLTDKLDEYRGHGDIRVIILVEPDVLSVKVYWRDADAAWIVERYDDPGQVVPLPEAGSTLSLGDIYDTLEPKARPRLQVVRESNDG